MSGFLFSIGKTLLGNRSAKRQRQKMNAMEDTNQGLYQHNFDATEAAYKPYEAPGLNALARLDKFAGGDASQFQASPDYQFRRDEGMRDIGNSFAARGGAFSGNALRALTDFNSGLASGEMNQWWGRNRDLVGIGSGATANIANAREGLTNSLAASNRRKAGASADELETKYTNYGQLVDDAESAVQSMYGTGGMRGTTGLAKVLQRYGITK